VRAYLKATRLTLPNTLFCRAYSADEGCFGMECLLYDVVALTKRIRLTRLHLGKLRHALKSVWILLAWGIGA